MFSRAYISFKAPEQLATFSQSYDGHAFKDKQGVWVHPCLVALGRRFIRWIGNEYHAVVEFAPYQKVPSAPKNDNRQGTIEDGTFFSLFRYTTFIGLTFQPFTLDEDFKSFVASLSAPDAPVETVAEPISPQKSTPLLEALIQSKEKANKRSGPGGVLTILSRTQQLKEDEQHFSRTSPIVPAEERAITGAGGSEKEGGNVKGRGKRSAPPIQPGTPSTPKPQKPRQVSGGKPAASTTKQPAPAAPSGDQQRAATPTKNRAPFPASSPDEARKKKRAKERAKKEKEKGKDKDKDKDRDEDEDDPTAPGSSGHQQVQAGGSREKLARKTTPGQPIPAASSSSQAQRGRTASVGAASESGPAQVQEGEPKSPTAERGRGRGRGGGGWGSSGRGRGGRGGAKEVDKMGVQVRIIQRPAPIVAPPAAPSEPALVSTPAPPPAENAGAEGGDGGTVPDGNPGGGGGGGESRGGRGGQRGWRGRGRGGNYRGRGGRGRGE